MNEDMYRTRTIDSSIPRPGVPATDPAPSSIDAELERAVEYVVDDCFFTVGQVIGVRKTVDYDAVIWWRDHYRAKFLAAMRRFGNRWTDDRQNVTGVAFMLGERAVRYSGDRSSVDLSSAMQAAADVERYCKLHSRRARPAQPPMASWLASLATGAPTTSTKARFPVLRNTCFDARKDGRPTPRLGRPFAVATPSTHSVSMRISCILRTLAARPSLPATED